MRVILHLLLITLLAVSANLFGSSSAAQQERGPITLVDYRGFPEGWDIRGDRAKAVEVYTVREQGNSRVLNAKVEGDPIRIFKKIAWNPFDQPVLAWKWRVLRWPASAGAVIQFYVSLDRDLVGIPKIEKYVWTRDAAPGTERKGGFFGANEVVIRSGLSEEWVAEEINVLERFRRFHGEDPGPKAVGVGLLVGSGIEMEISEVRALPISPTPPNSDH